jgi:hypothetical protein
MTFKKFFSNSNKGWSKYRYNNKYSTHYNDGDDDEGFKEYKFSDYKQHMFWLIGGSVLVLILLSIVRNIFKETFNRPAILDQYFTKPAPLDKVKGESKGETLCRDIAQKVFGKPFKKIRPDFLKNKVTGANLELDIFNEDLKVAIEFNGEQHYKYIPFFHKNYEAFLNQKYRDEIKKMLCKQHGIHLIEISFSTASTDIETIIKIEAQKLGFSLPSTP